MKLGRERIDALDAALAGRALEARSLVPSRFDTGAEGSYGGTMSLRATVLLPCALAAAVVDVLVPLKSIVRDLPVPRAGGGSGLLPMRLTSTQSGSGEGVNGLLGRLGLGKWSLAGGCTLERAGRPSKDQQHDSYKGEGERDTIVEPPLSAV